ncbi:hypothetical protein ED92_40050 [Amycolatopsis sp. MJM2582]|nr:hypothetical protein ED92_40050 [Amycolatopsis sp. MJM2582]
MSPLQVSTLARSERESFRRGCSFQAMRSWRSGTESQISLSGGLLSFCKIRGLFELFDDVVFSWQIALISCGLRQSVKWRPLKPRLEMSRIILSGLIENPSECLPVVNLLKFSAWKWGTRFCTW